MIHLIFSEHARLLPCQRPHALPHLSTLQHLIELIFIYKPSYNTYTIKTSTNNIPPHLHLLYILLVFTLLLTSIPNNCSSVVNHSPHMPLFVRQNYQGKVSIFALFPLVCIFFANHPLWALFINYTCKEARVSWK